MANPFPGMNPYLEDRALWNDFHARLAVYISNQLQPQLRPRYVASVEERVYLEFVRREIIPDVLILAVSLQTTIKASPCWNPNATRPSSSDW